MTSLPVEVPCPHFYTSLFYDIIRRGRYFYSQREIFSCNIVSCHWGKTELKLGWVHSIPAYTQRSHVVAGTKVPVRPVSSLSPSLCVWLQDWSQPWWDRVPAVTHEQSSAQNPVHFPRGCPIDSFCTDENPAISLPYSPAQSANLWKNSSSTNSQPALRIILPCYTVYLFPFLLLSLPLGFKFT